MLETIKWNSRYNPRGWVTMAGALVVLRALNALRKGESKRPPLWKHFDDTHHWDASAEEWVPNDDRDRATHHGSRTPNSGTQDHSR